MDGGSGGGGPGLEICLSSAHSFFQRPNAVWGQDMELDLM
jgi:hypothetical protein